VADIVAFVNKGDFPRSRLGEKQRGKILASWVTRKMRTMAQFGIRDADSSLQDLMEEPRGTGLVSLRNGSLMTSSLRNVEPAPQIAELGFNQQYQERPMTDESSYAIELPTNTFDDDDKDMNSSYTARESIQSEDTPTNPKSPFFELGGSPTSARNDKKLDDAPDVPPPRVGPKPLSPLPLSPSIPPIESRSAAAGDIWTLPSQRPAGALHVQNTSAEEDGEWPQEAIMHMNLSSR
jgi:hypothetical protein